jgi:hypothetical protein
MSAFISGLETSGWLKHIQAILETSVFISKVKYLLSSILQKIPQITDSVFGQ